MCADACMVGWSNGVQAAGQCVCVCVRSLSLSLSLIDGWTELILYAAVFVHYTMGAPV